MSGEGGTYKGTPRACPERFRAAGEARGPTGHVSSRALRPGDLRAPGGWDRVVADFAPGPCCRSWPEDGQPFGWRYSMKARWLLLTVSLGFLSLAAGAADWPQWRGPQRDGISQETGLLKEWPKEGPKLLWQLKD